MTVADRHIPYAQALSKQFLTKHFICDIDDSNESIAKKVRTAQLLKYNYMLTIGDQEIEHKTAALRTRDNVVHGEIDISDFLVKVEQERADRALMSPYSTAP
jgi:threonyl-tRNA synthetase